MILPLIAAGGLAIALYAYAASKSETKPGDAPALPPAPSGNGDAPVPGASDSLPSGGAPTGPNGGNPAPGTGAGSVPTSALPPGAAPLPPVPAAGPGTAPPPVVSSPGIIPNTGQTTGAVSVAPASGAIDDAFDQLVAAALAKLDVAALENLAKQAEARGLKDVARSIREEIARIAMTGAPTPTAAGPNTATTNSGTSAIQRAVISQKAGSVGPDVVDWQRVLNAAIPTARIKQDGIFGPTVDKFTKQWQTARGLTADGIVGPKSWDIAFQQNAFLREGRPPVAVSTAGKVVAAPPAAKPPVVLPETVIVADPGPIQSLPPANASVPSGEPDIRVAARQLTDYLTQGGGLAFRFKEDRKKVAAFLARLGVPDASGMYGRVGAAAVINQGFVPVVPYYWPTTGTQKAKNDFLALIKSKAAADPQRAAAWAKLTSDTIKA